MSRWDMVMNSGQLGGQGDGKDRGQEIERFFASSLIGWVAEEGRKEWERGEASRMDRGTEVGGGGGGRRGVELKNLLCLCLSDSIWLPARVE
ncbi:hypothetical protein Pcinc_001435 [Petrolisthes cinctipes]|uniref:Uncharacterized protein n=1 Tax=Petrolisthes cinctipes TaxID=88211 RepID=A0AAE1GRA3_PETCI|nr:hypothetical protein Pcinc_001435 [Petrolisthes cinctipes]